MKEAVRTRRVLTRERKTDANWRWPYGYDDIVMDVEIEQGRFFWGGGGVRHHVPGTR